MESPGAPIDAPVLRSQGFIDHLSQQRRIELGIWCRLRENVSERLFRRVRILLNVLVVLQCQLMAGLLVSAVPLIFVAYTSSGTTTSLLSISTPPVRPAVCCAGEYKVQSSKSTAYRTRLIRSVPSHFRGSHLTGDVVHI